MNEEAQQLSALLEYTQAQDSKIVALIAQGISQAQEIVSLKAKLANMVLDKSDTTTGVVLNNLKQWYADKVTAAQQQPQPMAVQQKPIVQQQPTPRPQTTPQAAPKPSITENMVKSTTPAKQPETTYPPAPKVEYTPVADPVAFVEKAQPVPSVAAKSVAAQQPNPTITPIKELLNNP